MTALRSILVVQTAFVGDVILTLPLIQLIHERYPETAITALTVPAAEELFANHPAVGRVIVYDKRGVQRGPVGLLRMAALLRSWRVRRGGDPAQVAPQHAALPSCPDTGQDRV